MSAVTIVYLAPQRAGRQAPAARERMVLDEALPAFDAAIVEHAVVGADPQTTWRALRELDFTRARTLPLTAAFRARDLCARAARRLRRAPGAATPGRVTIDDAIDGDLAGWRLLGERHGQELVLGAAGRFWWPRAAWLDLPLEELAAFERPGYGKVAVSFSLRPYGEGRTLVSCEARAATFDTATRARSARSWILTQPLARIAMRAVLRAVKADAERRAAAGQ